MTEPGVLPDVIERFLDEPVASPSLPELRAAGATAVRRRRRRGLAGAAAAVVLVVGGVALGQEALRGAPDDADDQVSPADTVEPPPGTRWAGIGRVVVAVPQDWADGAVRCGQATKDTVFFRSDEALQRCAVRGRHSSLEISDTALLGASDSTTFTEKVVNGHEVQTTSGCFKAIDGPCFAYLGVPDLDAHFRVHIYSPEAEARVQAVVDSLTVLPEGQAAIPLIESWHPDVVENAYAEIKELGLQPTIEDPCSNGLCALRAWTDPPAGRVVEAGTPVTVYVVGWSDGPEPYPLDALACANPYQRADGDLDVMAPSSAEEARKQGWPTDPLAAVEGVPDAPAWRDLGIADLTLLDQYDDGEARVSAQDAEGRTVLIMTVEELVRDAWAMTATETCG